MKIRAIFSLLSLGLIQGLDLSNDLEGILTEFEGVGLTAWSVDTYTGAVCTQGSVGRRINADVPENNDFVLDGDSRHHVGSVSKSMTAALLAIVLEMSQGEDALGNVVNPVRFQNGWDTTLAQALPDMETGKYAEVTLRFLVSMLSGMPDGPSAPTDMYGNTYYPVDADVIRQERRLAVQDALQLEPSSEAGTTYEYSNWNFIIAGHIIEDALDRSWEEALQTLLFEPLGMRMGLGDMFGPVATERDPWAHYLDELIPCNPEEDTCDNPAALGPAGTVSVPVAAMARYLSWHVECHKGRHTNILSQEACVELHSPPKPDVTVYGYGLLCFPEVDWAGSGLACFHNGSNRLNFYLTWMAFQQNRAYVGYTNSARDGDDDMVEEALALGVLAHLEGRETCDEPWASSYYAAVSPGATEAPTQSPEECPSSLFSFILCK